MKISNDLNLLRKFIVKTLKYAKRKDISKEKLIEIFENAIEDDTCPLNWQDAIIIRPEN